MKRLLLPSLLLLAAACSPGAGSNIVINIGGNRATRQVPAKTLPAGEAPAVVVDSPSGPVRLVAKEGKEIVVEAEIQGPTEQDLDRVQVKVEGTKEGKVAVGWTATDGKMSNLSVAFTVTAPPGTLLSASTGAGSIGAEGFTSGLKARSGTGSLKVRALKGDLDLDTKAGSIDVESLGGAVRAVSGTGSIQVSGPTGVLSLETAAGSVTVRGGEGDAVVSSGTGSLTVEGRKGNLSLDTKAGTVTVSGASGTVKAESGTGSVVVAGALRGGCVARTGAGSVTVVLPDDASLVVEGSTAAGSIKSEFPVTIAGTGATTIRGTLGDGKGGTLRMESGTGSIHLEKE